MWLDESEQHSVHGSDSLSRGWCLCCREDPQSLSVLVPLCGRTPGLHETAAGTALSVCSLCLRLRLCVSLSLSVCLRISTKERFLPFFFTEALNRFVCVREREREYVCMHVRTPFFVLVWGFWLFCCYLFQYRCLCVFVMVYFVSVCKCTKEF